MEVPTHGIFEKKEKRIHLKNKYCEFYLPKELVTEGKLVEILGNTVKTFGLFTVGIFDDNEKLLGYRVMKLPCYIVLNMYDSEYKTIHIGDRDIEVLVLKYHQGDDIMSSEIVKSILNVEAFTKLMIGGHLPQPLAYSEISNLWAYCFDMNGMSFKTASFVLELMTSVLCRDPKAPQYKYAKAYAEGASEYNYVPMSIRECCKYTSVFSAITFEDMTTMITSGINSSIEHPRENMEESILEKTIKY